MAQCPEANLPTGGDFPVSLVRNADDFLLRLRQFAGEYERTFEPLISRLRQQYTGKLEEQLVNDHLEFHARVYFINAFLAALNWRLDQSPENGLPNLVPEVPVRSEERRTVRFLDYLGLERDTDRPLLIVETKRPGDPLPRLRSGQPASTYSEIIARGCSGEALSGEWNNWLETLRDYVRSVQIRTADLPKRVMITNGDWLVVFLNPANCFMDEGQCAPSKILVFTNREEIEQRFNEIFNYLEYHQVLGSAPPLTTSELTFHTDIDASQINQAIYGLHLWYFEKPGYKPAPGIKVAPVVFLRNRYGAWIRVESPSTEYELSHSYSDLNQHLDEVKQAAQRLLFEINARLQTSLNLRSLDEHHMNEEDLALLPGVQELGQDEFLVVTGDKTHYLMPAPSVPECPYHDWSACKRDGVPSNPGPLLHRSVSPRSFFISGELHHCAHRDVSGAKASPIIATNRARCGPHSRWEGQAFCKIWRFEQCLCCRTCVFEEVCTKVPVFQLPCQASTSATRSAPVIRGKGGHATW